MTELAYLADTDAAYVQRFRAHVTARPPGGVVLDRTFFYPTGGGQPSDRGTLAFDGTVVPVEDVTKSGSAVVHRLGRPPGGGGPRVGVGAEVDGGIDWPRRFRHMRLHTGQHLLSARIFTLTQRRTRRAEFGGVVGYVDLDGEWPAGVELEAVAEDVNRLVRDGRTVRVVHVDRADWERSPDPRSGLVPLPKHLEQVRLIAIDGLDRCPCGGTHTRSTAEVGPMALSRAAGSARIVFTLGVDAPPTPSG
ncbi:MAG TPA: alanyl-tRNA editing protein [Thermoplasmata archaeon]|nr:alanyl-tRNA editing protein [Thermoplasmata archaeon]